MPLEFGITDALGSYRVTVQDSLRIQSFRIPVRLAPQIVDIDPDDWVLKDSIGGSGAPDASGELVADGHGLAFTRQSPLPDLHRPRVRVPRNRHLRRGGQTRGVRGPVRGADRRVGWPG